MGASSTRGNVWHQVGGSVKERKGLYLLNFLNVSQRSIRNGTVIRFFRFIHRRRRRGRSDGIVIIDGVGSGADIVGCAGGVLVALIRNVGRRGVGRRSR